MDWRPISADSHITEPPDCHRDHIDPAWREKAPHVAHKDGMGDIYVVDGMKTPVPMGLIAAAGIAPKDIRTGRAKFADLHRGYWLKGREFERLPSEYFRRHIALTFQDDWTAFQFAERVDPHQLMWANDFPRSDSTWPWSQEVIADQTAHLSPELKKRILRDNVVELYKLAA